MFSPKAIHLMIKHFDSIDTKVARKLMRKKSWSEPSLTSFLCELFDAETQEEVGIGYPISHLNKDLYKTGESLKVSFELETHEYTGALEGKVTQSDIGLVIKYRDYLIPNNSRSFAWLLQAKRVFPVQEVPIVYSELSKFSSTKKEQIEKIKELCKIIDVDFVR